MLLSLLSFIISTILLYFSSRALTKHFIKLFQKLFKSTETSIYSLFFLLLPGILLHEFSHILSAEFLQVRTGKLNLSPHFKNGHLQLGSAQIASTDPIRLTMIGIAPFLIGTTVLWLILTIGLNINLSNLNFSVITTILQKPALLLILFYWLLFTISNTMFSSPSDLQSAGLPIILFLIIVGIFKITNLNLPASFITYSTNLFYLLSTIFSITLFLNILLLIPLKILNSLANKKSVL